MEALQLGLGDWTKSKNTPASAARLKRWLKRNARPLKNQLLLLLKQRPPLALGLALKYIQWVSMSIQSSGIKDFGLPKCSWLILPVSSDAGLFRCSIIHPEEFSLMNSCFHIRSLISYWKISLGHTAQCPNDLAWGRAMDRAAHRQHRRAPKRLSRRQQGRWHQQQRPQHRVQRPTPKNQHRRRPR